MSASASAVVAFALLMGGYYLYALGLESLAVVCLSVGGAMSAVMAWREL